MYFASEVCCKPMQYALENEKIVLQPVNGKGVAFASGDHGYHLLFAVSFCPFCGKAIESSIPKKRVEEIRNGEGVIATVELTD